MKLKTLLLGSVAAFAVVGGAQAADLSVAEPVEYVKACDAFGAGYYYIPGSDTCLHIFGHVEFDANFHSNAMVLSTHSASWDFATTGEVEFNAKSMTDVGVLETGVGFTGTYNPNASTNDEVLLDYAYLKLGGLKAGHFGSTYRPGGSFVDDFGIANELRPATKDSSQVQLSFKAGGIALALGIEDPRETFGSSLPDNYSLPLIDGNLTFSGSNWSAFISAGYTQVNGGFFPGASSSSYGVSGSLTVNFDPSNAVMLEGSWGDGPFNGAGGSANGRNNGYAAFLSLQHYFSKTLRTDWDFSYGRPAGPTSGPSETDSVTAIGGDLVWLPYEIGRAHV